VEKKQGKNSRTHQPRLPNHPRGDKNETPQQYKEEHKGELGRRKDTAKKKKERKKANITRLAKMKHAKISQSDQKVAGGTKRQKLNEKKKRARSSNQGQLIVKTPRRKESWSSKEIGEK